MATQVFSNCGTYFGQYVISTDMSAVALSTAADALEKTAMGATVRTFKKGLYDTKANVEGYYSAGTGLISPILDETYFAIKDVPITIIPLTTQYVENCGAYSFPATIATWNSFGGVGEMMKFRATAETTATPAIPGYVAYYGTKTAVGTTYSTALQITGGAPAGKNVYCALHVFAHSAGGDTLDVTLQNDALVGFGDPTDCIAMTQSVAVGYEWKTDIGAAAHAEDFWRVKMVLSAEPISITFAVFFGIY